MSKKKYFEINNNIEKFIEIYQDADIESLGNIYELLEDLETLLLRPANKILEDEE